MHGLLETQNLPSTNHEKTENLSGPVTSKEIESVIKNLSINNNSGPNGFIGEFYQAFKELT